MWGVCECVCAVGCCPFHEHLTRDSAKPKAWKIVVTGSTGAFGTFASKRWQVEANDEFNFVFELFGICFVRVFVCFNVTSLLV